MKIVTVVPLDKGSFRTELTYFTTKDVKNGSIVSIFIRNKKILGLVISCQDVVNTKSGIKNMPFQLKKIVEIKEHSIFRNEFLESALELSSYFVSPKNIGVASFIPAIFREKYDEIVKFSKKNKNISSEKNIKKELTNTSGNIKTEKLLLQAQLEDRISFYKTLIRGYFALKKSVFIVLPTEYDIEIFQQALSKGIENFTFSMHGRLRPKKIIEKYEQIVNSAHGVLILGTAQYLSIPRTDLGAIIVEHENSDVYKIFPEVYASKINAKFILADSLLRYETIARKEIDGLSEVYPLSFRTNFDEAMINIINPSPNKEEENLEALPPNGGKASKFKIFSEKSIEEIQHSLKNKKNIFIFSLRKGLATHTICKDCNETINCEKCLAPVVLYLSRDNKKRMFVCNKCNTEKEPEIKCVNCGGWNLMPLGIGTDTVLAEKKKKFPKIKIFKLDRESVKTDKEAEKITKEFEKNSGSILVGTEMPFFYLKAKVDLSIVASFDSLWSIPNFKMSEKIIQLLLSILSKTEKKLIIQTKNKNDPALLAA